MIDILHTTISPCDNERRIFNQAETAAKTGFNVGVLALAQKGLDIAETRNEYQIWRLNIPFSNGGPLKFILFNLRLLVQLMFTEFRLLHAHDLWVLAASALACSLKKRPLIYDAHEYYAGLAILNHKPLVKRIWLFIEKICVPHIDLLITVNQQHARLFKERYPGLRKIYPILNLPYLEEKNMPLPDRKNAIVFQGMFKPGRGLAQLISVFPEKTDLALDLIGFGEIESEIKTIAAEKNGAEINFLGKVNVDELLAFARKYRAGVVLFEAGSINYKYASPNKFFEYVMAGTPLIASNIPTFEEFFKEFEVGILVDPDSKKEILAAILKLSSDESEWNRLHKNCLQARKKWNWEAQEESLLSLYHEVLSLK